MPSIRQTSFIAGELSPSLHGRNDLERYVLGLRKALNCVITPQGACLNRAGTKYVAATKASGKVRLIPFILSNADTFVIELGNLYARFYKNGAPVLLSGLPYEVVTPYLIAHLWEIQYNQVGDVIVLTHSQYAPRELTRVADTNWTLSSVNFAVYDSYFLGGRPALRQSVPTADATHPAREWLWKVTSIVQDSVSGATYETLPFTVSQSAPYLSNGGGEGLGSLSFLSSNVIPVYFDKPVTVDWSRHPVSGPAIYEPTGFNTFKVIAWRVYRGRGRLFGLVGETSAGISRSFVDVGNEPDYSTQPPSGTNPFLVLDNEDFPLRTEEPAAVAHFNQRRVYGGTEERPENAWGSRIAAFENFDVNYFKPGANDAFEYRLASHRRESIRSFKGLDRLFAFTSGGVWTLEQLGPDLVPEVTKHTDEGASFVPPLVAGDSLLYVREKGVGVNDIAFQNERGKLGASDLTTYSRHLVEDSPVVDWAYAHDPTRIVWAVRSDGTLLSMTYQRDQQVLAWTPHQTQGTVESVCSVPEGNEDAVYLSVLRGSSRFIERMSTRKVRSNWTGKSTEACFLDCAVLKTGSASTAVTGLSHLEGKEVYAVADGFVVGPFTVSGGVIALAEAAAEVQVGLSYVSDVELLDLAGGRTEMKGRQKNVHATVFDVQDSRGLKAGQTFSKLTPWKQRTVADAFSPVPLYTGEVAVNVDGSWNPGGRAVLRQADPCPLTVLAVTRKFTVGDD